MPNERLADLTQAEILEYVSADPALRQQIAKADPRVQLMERLYGDDLAKKDLQRHSKRLYPKASIPELDIAADVRKELEPDITAIKELRTTLETRDKGERRRAFVASLIEAGAQEADVEKIETFMLDNEIGPKSVMLAVEKYYEAGAVEAPTSTEHTFELPEDDHMKALLNAPPGADLDMINMRFAERIFHDMVGGGKRRSPVMA